MAYTYAPPAPTAKSAAAPHTKAGLYNLLNKWMREVTLRDLGRGSTAVRVACSLAYYAQRSDSVSRYFRDGQAWAYPGQTRLARELGVSVQAVTGAIKKLEGAKLIEVLRSVGVANKYKLIPQRQRSTPQRTLVGTTPQRTMGTPPNLRAENPPTYVDPNIPLRGGDKAARSCGAVRSGRTVAPRGRRPLTNNPPRRQPPLVEPVTVKGERTRWRRLATGEVLTWGLLTDFERRDADRHYPAK